MKEQEKYIQKLKTQIKKWNHEYYVLAQPTVSDREYDRVFDELKKLDPSALSVGSDLSTNSPLVEVPHRFPMLSLDKVYTLEELQKWLTKTPADFFSIEPKIDGVSVSLEYQHGQLVKALTRGDGNKGLDITHNILTLSEVPKQIQSRDTLLIRGEVYMTRQAFEKFRNLENIPYANPRNLTAGVLRRLNSSDVAKVPLQIFLYQAQRLPQDFQTRQDALEFLKTEHFPLPPYIHFFHQKDDIGKYIEEIQSNRSQIPFEIDGLVIKIDRTEIQKELGETAHHPRWAIAFKFESPTGITTVQNIVVQVGRTGKITPVAHLAPVKINGSTVTKAILHNKEYLEALEIGIDDLVSVSKRGEIIPAIEEVIEKKGSLWHLPTHCPSCHAILVVQGAHHFCPNHTCPERVRMELLYFVKQLEIDGFGNSLIELLYYQFDVRNPQDLWTVDWDQLEKREGFGPKKVQNLQNSLQKTPSKTSFKKLLVALGIPEIGENAVQILLGESKYNSLKKLLSLTTQEKEALQQLKGIGHKTAQRIVEVFSPNSKTVINLIQLEKLGFALEENITEKTDENSPLVNTIWLLTGTFENYKPREQAGEIIKKLGGSVVKTLTKEVTHLLYGQKAGSKLTKAKESRVTLVNETEFTEKYEPLLAGIPSNQKTETLFEI